MAAETGTSGLAVGAKGTYDFGGAEPLPVTIESSRPGRTVPTGRYPKGEPTTIWRGIDQSSGRFFEFYGDQEKLFKPAEPRVELAGRGPIGAILDATAAAGEVPPAGDRAAASRFWSMVDAARPDLAVSPEERADLTTLLSARAGAAGKSLAEYLPTLVHEVRRGETMPGAAVAQAKRGALVIEDGRRVLYLMRNADSSTFVHEFAHAWRRELAPVDHAIAARWSGAMKLQGTWAWDRPAEERFARGFERYLSEGRAPTAELAGVFERFKAWLIRLYQGIKGSPLDEQLSPGVRRVFDRLLTGKAPSRGDLATLAQPDLFGPQRFEGTVGRQERLEEGPTSKVQGPRSEERPSPSAEAPKAIPPQAEGKQPWEMTQWEYAASLRETAEPTQLARTYHPQAVEEAAKEGKLIPLRVLDEYRLKHAWAGNAWARVKRAVQAGELVDADVLRDAKGAPWADAALAKLETPAPAPIRNPQSAIRKEVVEERLRPRSQRPGAKPFTARETAKLQRWRDQGEQQGERFFQGERQPGEEKPAGAGTPEEAQAEADAEAAAEAERAAEAEVHEPPAEAGTEGEQYAEAGPASLRTRAILSSLKPTEIAKAARMAAAPGEPSLAVYPSVAKALDELVGASKIRRQAETKARELLKGESARVMETPTPLLDWMGEGAISAGKGAEHWAEIRDALAGRPWLRKFFDTKQVGGRSEIDVYVERAREAQEESGFKSDNPSAFLDQLVREADAAHEAEMRGADVAQRLRKLSESVPTEDVQQYKDAADLWEAKVRAEHAARDAVQAAMEPYLMAKGSPEFEASLKKLAAESKAEIARVREESAAELRAAERQYEYDLTATRGQIWSIRRQAMAAAEKRIASAEARQTAMEMMRRAFKEAGQALPLSVRGKLWRLAEGEGIKTPKDLARAMDRADELLYDLQQKEAVEGVNRLLKTVRRDERKMPEPYRSEVSAIMRLVDPQWTGGVTWDQINAMRQFAADHPEVPMPRKEIDELSRLDRRSLGSMNPEQLKTVQNTLASLADLADEARSRMFLEKAGRRAEDRQAVLAELAVHKPLRAWQRNVRPESALGRVWLAVENFFKYGHIDTETLTKPMSAQLAAVMVELPALAHNTKEARVLRPFLEGLYAKTQELLGVRFGSPEHRRMWYSPVTVELPQAKNVHERRVKSITLTAGELEGIHRNLADPDTYQELLEGGLNFKTQPTKGLDRPGPTDPKLMLTGEDLLALKFAGDPKIRALGDWMQARSNEPDFKKAIDEAHYGAKGFHLEMPENRWHRVRARIERPRFEKDFTGNIEALFPESRPSFKARTGTHAAVVIDDPLGTYVQEAHLAARLIGMSEPLRDAYTLLGTPDVQREIVNRFGQKAYDQLVDHLNFVTGSHLTVPGAGEELVRRLMDTASMSILLGNPGPILNQGASLPMFGVYLKPSSMAAGFKAFAHPAESVKKMLANSDAIWLRYHASNVRELLSGPEQSAQSLWRGKFRRVSESAIVGADELTEAFLFEACEAETGGDLQKAARLAEWITDHANQTTNPVYSAGFGREASRQPAYKLVSMFMNAPNRTLNMAVQAAHAVAANPRDPKALAHAAKVAACIAGSMAILTAIGAGTAYLRSGGREKPTAGSLALDMVGNTLGNAYFVGQAFDAFQEHLMKHRSLELRQNVAERTTTESLKAVVGLMDAVGQAVQDERYKGGPERGKRRAGDTVLRALESAYRATGMISGLPQAPLSYGKGIWRFTHPAAVEEGAEDAMAASGDDEAAAGQAVRRLVAQKWSLGRARTAVRAQARRENWSAQELEQRLARLTARWRQPDYRATGMVSGLPQAAVIEGGEDVAAAAGDDEAAAGQAVRRLVAQKWSLGRARTAVRAQARRENWSAQELEQRLARLTARWRRVQVEHPVAAATLRPGRGEVAQSPWRPAGRGGMLALVSG